MLAHIQPYCHALSTCQVHQCIDHALSIHFHAQCVTGQSKAHWTTQAQWMQRKCTLALTMAVCCAQGWQPEQVYRRQWTPSISNLRRNSSASRQHTALCCAQAWDDCYQLFVWWFVCSVASLWVIVQCWLVGVLCGCLLVCLFDCLHFIVCLLVSLVIGCNLLRFTAIIQACYNLTDTNVQQQFLCWGSEGWYCAEWVMANHTIICCCSLSAITVQCHEIACMFRHVWCDHRPAVFSIWWTEHVAMT
jgi:hypothetical protein